MKRVLPNLASLAAVLVATLMLTVSTISAADLADGGAGAQPANTGHAAHHEGHAGAAAAGDVDCDETAHNCCHAIAGACGGAAFLIEAASLSDARSRVPAGLTDSDALVRLGPAPEHGPPRPLS